ncbi:MAG TPA: hypothetical protein VGD91_11505 [Trebonia sp.]
MGIQSAPLRGIARVGLGLVLAGAGVVHLTIGRQEFTAQVPETLVKALPVGTDAVVLGSGAVEIALGAALAGLPGQRRRLGAVAAAYFVAIFPGNISQLLKHADAFGLDSDGKRLARLFFQPVLVLWSLFAGEII